ncbi:DUF2782 domain-containing protein [Kaarinaea lacus]
MTQRILLITVFFWVTALPVQAQDEAPLITQEIEPGQVEQEPSGEVKIKGGKDEVISEFRINGQLYMIRITPRKGVPYYLVDSDGDGNLETRWNELAPDILIPAWVLLRW